MAHPSPARVLGPRTDAIPLVPSRLPSARATQRVVDLDGQRLVVGLARSFVGALCRAATTLSEGRLRLSLPAPLARHARVRWSVPRRELEPARELCAYHVVTAGGTDEGPRALWRLGAPLVEALLEGLGSDTTALSTRALVELELAWLDAVVLEALTLLADEDSPAPARRLVQSGSAALGSPLRVLRSREALVEVALALHAEPTGRATTLPGLEVVLPLAAASAWAAPRPVRELDFAALSRAVGPLVTWTVALGTLALAADALQRLGRGDVLFPAPALALRDTTPPALRARLEAKTAEPVPIEVLLRAPHAAGLRLGALDDDDPEETPMTRPQPRSALEQALAEAPLELRLELGRVVLSAEQLAALHAGDVIDPGLASGTVELWVGARRVGLGELVELEGQIGVRVTHLEGGDGGDAG